jgi:hypothetical protein
MLRGRCAIRRLGLVAVISAALAGCGGSGTSSSTTPTRAGFVARADAICKTARTKLNAQQASINAAARADQTSDTAANRHALATALNQDANIATPLLNQIRALAQPAGEHAVISDYVSGVGAQIGLVKQLATAIDKNDVQAAQSVSQRMAQGKASVDAAAQRVGFKVCGSGA